MEGKFSDFTKNEVLSIFPETSEGERAWLSAAIRTSSVILIEKKNAMLRFESEASKLVENVIEIVKNLYRVKLFKDFEPISSGAKAGQMRFFVKIPAGLTRQMLLDTGVMTASGDVFTSFESGIDPAVIENETSAKNYLRGLYAGAGSASVPKDLGEGTKSAGYNLEFSLTQPKLAADVKTLLHEFGFAAKCRERKEAQVVYIKDREVISNFFAYLGAMDSVLAVQEAIIERELANRMNRETNFSTANFDKTAKASAKLAAAIQYIDETIGLESLPAPLYEAAVARRDNPLATMVELGAILPDIGKSGLNHRFRKILKIAEDLKDS